MLSTRKKTERERPSGGREIAIEYSYTQEWRSQFQSSPQNPAFKNTRPSGVELGVLTRNCSRVAYGDGFELTDALINQCGNFQPADERIGVHVKHGSGYTFHNGSDSFFYFRADQLWRGQGPPMIGDARVKFEYVPNGCVSVIALQTEGKVVGCKKDSFLPYRLIPYSWCLFNEEQEKMLLTQQGKKLPAELAVEDSMGGCFWICCCACNLVGMCYSAFMLLEIHHLFEKNMSAAMCLQEIKARNTLKVWIHRFIGCVLMFAGLYCTCSPMRTTTTMITFLSLWVFCFVVTLTVTTLIICLAYLRYQPLTALLYLFIAGFIVVATIVANTVFNKIHI